MSRYGDRIPRDFDLAAYHKRFDDFAGPAVDAKPVCGPANHREYKAREAAKGPWGDSPRLLESEIAPSVFAALRAHPKVAWVERMNVGGTRFEDGQYVRFAFAGCSDNIGQLKDGRFLACEVKRPGESPTKPQAAFLLNVILNGGVGFVARGVEDVWKELEKA